MSDQPNLNTIGEISTIREILVGGQLKEFNSKIEEMSSIIAESQKLSNDQLENCKKSLSDRFNNLEKSFDERLTALENKINQSLNNLKLEMVENSTNQRKELGSLFKELGEKLV